MTMRKAAWSAAVAIALWSYAARVAADGGGCSTFSIDVRGDDDCIRKPDVTARVLRWLANRSADPDARVVIHVTASEVTFRLFHADVALAERTFVDLPKHCGQRLDALSLALALAIEQSEAIDSARQDATRIAEVPPQPEAAAPADSEAAQSAAVEAPDLTLTPIVEPTPQPAEERSIRGAGARLRFTAGPAVVTHEGLQPVAAAAIGVEWASGPFSLESALAGSTAGHAVLGDGSVRTQFAALQLRFCLQLPIQSFSLSGCAGALASLMFASGRGFAPNHSTTLPWVAPLVRIGVRFPTSSAFSVRLSADLPVDLIRPEFRTLEQGNTAQTLSPGPLGLWGTLALVYEVP